MNSGLSRLCAVAFVFGAITVGTCGTTATNRPRLTLDRLFDSSEFKTESYGEVTWSKHGPGYFKFEKAQDDEEGKDLVRVEPASGKKELIVPAHAFVPSGESSPLSIDGFEFSADQSKLLIFTNSKRVWRGRTRGDYWLLDLTSRELKQLGGDAPPASMQFATFSPDGSRIAYVQDHNLYVQDLRALEVTALTTNGCSTLINGTFDWVYEEELGLRNGFRWSPDSRWVAYWQLDTSNEREFYLINDTDGLYSRPIPIPYPKAGESNAVARIGVVSAEGGPTRWLELPGQPQDQYIAHMDWASNSTQIVVQEFNRLQNTNTVFLAEAETGKARPILLETDSTWVDNVNPTRWLDKGTALLWLSERDGWRHAYRASLGAHEPSLITKCDFDLVSVEAVDDHGGWLYFAASPENAGQRYLYRVPLTGGKPERVTPASQPGTHSYHISPNGQWAIHTWSSFNTPPVTDLIRLPSHESVRVLEANEKLKEKLDTLDKPAGEFFQVDIGEGVRLDGWCLKPPGFDAAKKYPVLFYVYGEPGGQTVSDAWRDKRHLWHWMLAQQGYIVMSVDNRGTPAPRERQWRKSIFHKIGQLNAADQAAAVRALLKARSYLDPERVGIWGWSGGGSSTLNAILQYPDVYQTAMAVAPVPNFRFYDSIYEERYMGLPQDNEEAYRLGSPITHARGLKGNLLVVHGTGDDNVHYQGTEALINEFVTYKKRFTMMAYPNRTHSISEGKNTTYHLYSLLTRYLNENLPLANPRAAHAPTLTGSGPN
jgi:dipeptidyl-peptidase-4